MAGEVTLLVFALCVGSAILHASWNMAARKVKGDLAVLTGGMVMALSVLTPIALFVPKKAPWLDALPFVIATGVTHVFYTALLGLMYAHADGAVSVVYPAARGTGVAGTALLAGPILSEPIRAKAWGGILCVVVGILLLGTAKPLSRFLKKRVAALRRDEDATQMLAGGRPPGPMELTEAVEPSPVPSQQWCGGTQRAICFGMMCGATIICYNLVDKAGVGVTHPLHYMVGMLVVQVLGLAPYLLLCKPCGRALCASAWRDKKRYMAAVGFGPSLTYLIILHALTLAKASVVTALREVSVVFGALFGVIFLGEEVSVPMVVGVGCVVVGLVTIKLS